MTETCEPPAASRPGRDSSVEHGLALAAARRARRERATEELAGRRAARGLEPEAIDETLARLHASGLLDDGRYAQARATALAGRGAGDALIRHALEGSGVPVELVEEALAAIEPERERARAIVARRGWSARTARLLRAKGFDEELIGSLVAGDVDDELR
ncbi:MAG: RecX family transcriptional regulator [Thermoleophilia bacterium]|nr:RecX family transcriptional regulator [Thermoleophilia bacterium]